MDVDEFVKRVRPAARKSVLAPWLEAIQVLRGKDYTLDQVLEFLAENGVTISRAGLSAYLRRKSAKAEAKTPDAPAPTPPRQQQRALPAAVVPATPEPEDAPAGSHNPADLNRIISDKPDLAALAKHAKRGNRK